jgi:hypothetical protein
MSRRHVSIHLTPYAPSVGAEAIGDRVRWMTMWRVTPAQAIAELCNRVQTLPGRLKVRSHAEDIEILGPSAHGAGDVLLALVKHGLTVEEVASVLEGLANGRRVAA